jgi:hypothetical protein
MERLPVDGTTLIVIIVALLIAVGFLGDGVAWLVIHETGYCIAAASLVVVTLVCWAVTAWRSSVASRRRITRSIARANRARAAVEASRRSLERKSVELKRIQTSYHEDISFTVLINHHNESRVLADRWYEHKRQAQKTHSEMSGGLQKLRTTHGKSATIIQGLRQSLSLLSAEIARGGQAVTEFNSQTGELRDHINAHCGRQGREWYQRLEERKRRRREVH